MKTSGHLTIRPSIVDGGTTAAARAILVVLLSTTLAWGERRAQDPRTQPPASPRRGTSYLQVCALMRASAVMENPPRRATRCVRVVEEATMASAFAAMNRTLRGSARIQRRVEELQAFRPWTGGGDHPWRGCQLSDPLRHDGRAFRYLVHASNWVAMGSLPDLEHRYWFSASVVDRTHPATFQPYGVILKIRPGQVIAASSANIMSPFDRDVRGADEARRTAAVIRARTGVMSVPEVLRYTGIEIGADGQLAGWIHDPATCINEVLVAGPRLASTARTQVTGVFYTALRDGRTLYPRFLDRARRLARDLDVPLVRLEQRRKYVTPAELSRCPQMPSE